MQEVKTAIRLAVAVCVFMLVFMAGCTTIVLAFSFWYVSLPILIIGGIAAISWYIKRKRDPYKAYLKSKERQSS